jgi:hypothetical protein
MTDTQVGAKCSIARIEERKVACNKYLSKWWNTYQQLGLALVAVLHVDGARETSVDAEDLMVDDGGQGQAVECLVALLPDVLAHLHAESLLALVQEGLLHVVHLPAVHLRRDMEEYIVK